MLQYLGYAEVDCVVLDIDEQKEKALNVALNKISGAWDVPLLTALLRDLDDSGFDATLTGFDVSEMSELFDDQSEIVEDDPPEAAPEGTEPFTKTGDRWVLGRHVLYCGDSTEKNAVAALMGNKKADLVVTDPPYNVAYEGSNGLTIQNDNMPEEQFLTFLTAAFSRMHDGIGVRRLRESRDRTGHRRQSRTRGGGSGRKSEHSASRPAPEARRPLRKDRYPSRRDHGTHDLLHREQRMDRTAGGRAHRKTLRGRYDRGAKEAQIRTAAAAQNTVLRSLFSCVLSANSAFLVWTFPFFSGLIVLPKAKEETPP